jgi:hypothetical protein
MPRVKFALPLIALLALARPTYAWNGTGHQVVAQIAWRDLKPAARDKALALLKQHPHFVKLIEPADLRPDDPDYAPRSFMAVATWPDLIRTARSRAERDFHHGEWHYVNFPLIADGTDKSALELPPLGEHLDPAKPPENILQALEWAEKQLRAADVAPADKAVALAWLIHLVGDVHQPLHCSARFSPDYLKGDRGGNLFMVKYHGVVTNLHAFWDDLLGGYVAPRLITAIADKALEGRGRDTFAKELAATKYTDWSAESFAIARDVVYQGGKLPGVTRQASVADKGATTPELPDKYDQTARETARTRVTLAGYRLADLLNRIFE